MPSIPKGSKTIFITYGNPALASTSNGERTFEFFDDFNGTALDKKEWMLKGDNYKVNVNNGILSITTGAGLQQVGAASTTQVVPPLAYKTLMRRASGNYDVYGAIDFTSKPGYGAMLGIGNYGKEWRHVVWQGEGPHLDYTFGTSDNNWHTFEDIVCGRNNIATISGVMTNHNLVGEKIEDVLGNFGFSLWSQSPTTLEADWVFIRKCAFVEPTTQIGGEEEVPLRSLRNPI